jgi:hypothetical protein
MVIRDPSNAPAMPAASGERASGCRQKSTLMLRRKSPRLQFGQTLQLMGAKQLG